MNDENQNIQAELHEDEINLLEVARSIVRGKSLIIKATTIAAVLSVCISLALPNIYTATATVLPPPRETGIGAATLTGGGAALLAAANAYVELYISVLKSRTVVDAVIKRLNLQQLLEKKTIHETRKAVSGMVTFQAGKDGTISVSGSNRDPKLAALLANTFVEEMASRSVQLYIAKAGNDRSFLEKRLMVIKDELIAAENALKDFQQKNKTIKADAQATASIDGIARLRAEIVNKEVQLAMLRNSQTDESSDVKTVQAAITRLKGQLAAMSGSGGGSVIPAAGDVPALGLEYSRLVRDVKSLEAVFEQLTRQYEVARTSEARESGTVQVIDEAIVPVKKSRPKRALIVLTVTLAAFLGAVVYVLARDYFSRLSPEDAEIVADIKYHLRIRS